MKEEEIETRLNALEKKQEEMAKSILLLSGESEKTLSILSEHQESIKLLSKQ